MEKEEVIKILIKKRYDYLYKNDFWEKVPELDEIITLLKREDKCDNCGYKTTIKSLRKLWGDLL